MAARFLGKTSLVGLTPMQVEGHPVLEHYERIRTLLLDRVGPRAADLLAEPVVTWAGNDAPGSVSWYSEATEDAEPLHAQSHDRNQRLGAALRETLIGVAPLLQDPELGPWLQGALTIASRDGIRAVDDRVILTDWGLTTDIPQTGSPLARLAVSPLGEFITVSDQSSTPEPPLPPTPSLPIPPPAAPVGVIARGAERGGWTWWLLPAGLVVAMLFLVLGLWLGAHMVAERLAMRPSTVLLFDEQSMRQAIERQRAENAALEHQIAEGRKALEGNVCQADPAQVPQIGLNRHATVPPATIPPPQGRQPFKGSLADLLKQAVVFVITPMNRGASTGSGFFITPDLIVTNRHVIEHGLPDKIFVTNTKLGRLTAAHLVAETPDSTIGNLDVAVLKLDQPAAIQPLTLTTAAADLDPVIAAGYPALTVSADEAYERLLQSGDVNAVPQVILTDGKISAIQETSAGIRVMPHTAPISGGNSGGPLVDACGRVVGINTFIAADRDQAASAKWAQKSDQVAEFLKRKGIAVILQSDACSPPAPQPAPLQPQAAAPAAPGAPTTPGTPPAASAR